MQRWATFDCYGTIIDWERGIKDTFAALWPDSDPIGLLARYHEIEPLMQSGSSAPYREVLADVLLGIADAEGLPVADRFALSDSLPAWPPFDEVPSELQLLRDRGWRIAILSNTDPDLLDASVRNIGVETDLRITVADSGSYKPAHAHWLRFFEETGADRSGHVHVAASLFHDIAPCAELGLLSVWINRNQETSDLQRAAELPDLGGLSDTLERLVPA